MRLAKEGKAGRKEGEVLEGEDGVGETEAKRKMRPPDKKTKGDCRRNTVRVIRKGERR